MVISDEVLRPEERIAFALRGLYSRAGFAQFKMSRFEEYDLYVRSQEYLISHGVITFNDPDGRVMALKPDVTLSIIKNVQDAPGAVRRVYYHENVYRLSDGRYKEIMQTGLECIGDLGQEDIRQVISLAVESAGIISQECRMVFSHVGFVEAYLRDWGVSREAVAQALSQKNGDALAACCPASSLDAMTALMQTYPSPMAARDALAGYCRSDFAREQLEALLCAIPQAQVDFTLSSDATYYSGILFQCFHPGLARAVLSGGQYDHLMKKLGRKSQAVGFAVYLDELARLGEAQADGYLNIALPKGRLGEKVYDLFEKAGWDCPSIREENRRLVFENGEKKLRFFWVKPSDVAIYVARGAADVGVAGYDILREYKPDVYELCDLGLGKCRMAVAAPRDFVDDGTRQLRVATKFSAIAQEYYTGKCRDIDIIHLNGSIELAPLLGLSDVIVDIVETGKTLLENGLEPREEILAISARLIANKAAYPFKKDRVEALRQSLAKQVTL